MNGLLCFDERFENLENGKITISVLSGCFSSWLKSQEENVGRKICEATPL